MVLFLTRATCRLLQPSCGASCSHTFCLVAAACPKRSCICCCCIVMKLLRSSINICLSCPVAAAALTDTPGLVRGAVGCRDSKGLTPFVGVLDVCFRCGLGWAGPCAIEAWCGPSLSDNSGMWKCMLSACDFVLCLVFGGVYTLEAVCNASSCGTSLVELAAALQPSCCWQGLWWVVGS